MVTLERNLRALLELATTEATDVWTTPDSMLVPANPLAAQIVKAAKEVRTAAAGKAIAPNCLVTSTEFGEDIKLAPQIGRGPQQEATKETVLAVGEVTGFERASRVVHLLVQGHQSATDIGIDMAQFQQVVCQLAAIPGNQCRAWYLVEKEGGRVVRKSLRRLQVNQGDLFAQLPEFDKSEMAEATRPE